MSVALPRQNGQAAVESAIVLPLMTFLVLGTVQLTLVQQAELMTEYAAFQACRAGIVWNGNPQKMENAARVALAPTVVHSSIFPTAGKDGTTDLLAVADHVLALEIADGVGSLVGMPIVRVDTIHPTKLQFNEFAGEGPSPDELEFDDVGYFLKPGTRTFDGFAGNEPYRQALQLTIRIRYLYQLRIPFADWIIQTCWFASRAPLSVYGQIGQETLHPESIVEGGDEEVTAGVEAASAKVIAPPGGHQVMSRADFLTLFALRKAGVFLFPLSASYTMRMQSNFYRKYLP